MARRKDESREEYNLRMGILMKVKYIRRKNEAIVYLGGHCVDCGTTELLEFDHRNPSEKSFTIAHKLNGTKWSTILAELDKCDLRCIPCHGHMTAYQRLQDVDVLLSLHSSEEEQPTFNRRVGMSEFPGGTMQDGYLETC